ncbi:winged helix DNA-binding domain-containing protein [Actinocorallia populi]|uniref:winged helix DNA-binding domain-containing protein n=1 Tax=Actinocorallia populi TaxID=2079200 RepID=UPI000D08F718|nr:winged helix DNA-binding domain-containing protein [Actinocorallia populi]
MTGSGKVLSRRALNRALLRRQLLDERTRLGTEEVLRHLVGLQAQQPIPPYFGLWSRVEGFAPDDLAELVAGRKAVRASLMRCTVHLVTADDCLRLRHVMGPVIDRQLRGNSTWAAALAKIPDLEALAEAAREFLAEPRGSKELGERLGKQWPEHDPAGLARVAQFLVPVLQTPPRGLWGRSGMPAWAEMESWLGSPVDRTAQAGEVLLRYLAAFGPASVADMQKWSGLTGLAEVCAGLDLRTFRDEQGRLLYDLPDLPLPDEDAPVPVRLLAEYDNVVLSHADRSRILDAGHLPRVVTKNGIVKGTVLVDGFVCGTWKLGKGSVAVTPFAGLSPADTEAVEAEAHRLLAFASPAAKSPKVDFDPAG